MSCSIRKVKHNFPHSKFSLSKGIKKTERRKRRKTTHLCHSKMMTYYIVAYRIEHVPICKKFAVKLKQIISSLNFPRFSSFLLYTSNNMLWPLLFFSFYFMFISFSYKMLSSCLDLHQMSYIFQLWSRIPFLLGAPSSYLSIYKIQLNDTLILSQNW